MTAGAPAEAPPGAEAPPLVTAAGLSFAYGDRVVFRDVRFQIRPGELVALCGPNGAGKSTLLRLLVGMQRAQDGHVVLGGDSVERLSRREIARRAALLPQDAPSELPLTVREAVALGRLPHLGRFEGESAADEAAIERALEATDTAPLAERPVTELSGGERHRVHLARALAQEAPLVLLDEPIAGLDLAHQLQALDLLRATVNRGRAALIAIHDLSLAARSCDRMLLLADGRVQADGPPVEVLTPAHLERFFAVRAAVERDERGRPYVVPLEALAPTISSKAARR
jgi:iron complex transport system ATP-binding protein